MSKKQIAFTLIELLVVIAIIGILSGLIVVAMGGLTNSANIAKAQIFSNSLRNALMMNMIAEYKLDGNANDTWGNHTTGTVSGATSISNCIQSSCYSFNGASDYIELPDASDLRMTTGGTISAWIYPKSLGGNNRGRIVDKTTDINASNGYNIRLYDNNVLMSMNSSGSNIASPTNGIKFNQWQLITVSFNGSGRQMYINGIAVSQDSQPSLPPNSAGVTRIGNSAFSTSYAFDGYIDEVRMYNTVVPTSQIKEHYYAGLNSLLSKGEISFSEYKDNLNKLSEYSASN